MSVPSMVHRSGDSLIVRSVVSGDALFGSADGVAEDDVNYSIGDPDSVVDDTAKDLPDCKVKRNYSCSHCTFFTQNPRSFLYHLKDVHNEKVKIYECPNCLYASKHYQKLLRHTKMVHGTMQGLEVGESARKIKKKSAGTSEEEIPMGQDDHDEDEEFQRPSVYKCSMCSFTSKIQSQLSRHEREEHMKTKFFRCTKCNYVTHIKARFTKHVKYHSMPMIKCDMCDFRTPYKWNLDRHCKNHNGRGAFRCSACNFTADIKQSLTVHEMNHHVPPVGQAIGLGVGRRRNKVGASDATAAEEAAQQQLSQVIKKEPKSSTDDETVIEEVKKIRLHVPNKKTNKTNNNDQNSFGSDFVHPDDIVSHSNGKVYLKNKCRLCNYKTAWDSEMIRHEQKAHNIVREDGSKPVKKSLKPLPKLIPIPAQTSVQKLMNRQPPFHIAEIPELKEPEMSQKDMNDICAKSTNSSLKDFASLFSSEEIFKEAKVTTQVPDLIPTSLYSTFTPKANSTINNINNNNNSKNNKKSSFFDDLKDKLLSNSTSNNLICTLCGHESACLTEQVKHQKTCGKELKKIPNIVPVRNISASRCQYCRQRCKTSTDLYNHLSNCTEYLKTLANYVHGGGDDDTVDDSSEQGELRIDEDRMEETETKPHPMENKVFIWNDIQVPMDIEVDDSNYEYTDDKIDDNVSIDLSTRTQSPGGVSDHSFLGQDYIQISNSVHHSPATTDKIPTHGNDITIAQHKRVFKCPHCTFWASTASRFHVHIVGHLNKKPFECSLCAYRSNWRWDITKHIKLKSVRDHAHESAKVLMTDETGRRNYTKYNKYLTEIPVTGDQTLETSGGSGTRPRAHHDKNFAPSTSKSDAGKLNRVTLADFSPLMKSTVRPPPALKPADGNFFAKMADKKRHNSDSKRTLFKCKKCNFKDASRDILLEHVKGHYQQQSLAQSLSSLSELPDISLRGTSPDKDEASVNSTTAGKGGHAPFRCGHCNQVSNWKHVIQRHCRLKHSGDIRVVSNKNGQEKIEMEEQPDEPDHIDVPQEGIYKCHACPFATNSDNEFDYHIINHNQKPDSIMKCHFCNYYVSEREDLVNHLRLHGISDPDDFLIKISERNCTDGELKKFKCTLCPYVTNSKSQYTYHKQFHKPRGGQYTCTQCSYNVSKRHLLHQHLKVHGITITPHKQNGEPIDMDDISDEIEEVPSQSQHFETLNFTDIPLVWVSKNGKFSKMFKCRYCPHVNLRKVNIQEHEKMHSIREKNPNSSRQSDVEHRCTECNYVCNNAGVLSSHSKVHQGLYGIVHQVVDPTRSDEEQIRELNRKVGLPDSASLIETLDYEIECEEPLNNSSGSILYFCKDCPARFLKENEFAIHKRFHGVKYQYKCDYCTFSAKQADYVQQHQQIHSSEYQERTKHLQKIYVTSINYPQPQTYTKFNEMDEIVWMVQENNNKINDVGLETLSRLLNKPPRSSQSVPLSGTELFQQKSEAEQKQAAALAQMSKESSPSPQKTDPQFGTLMHGNPDFIYPTSTKNGKMKEKRYKCHKCPSAFDKREQYKIHLGLHGAKQRYCCDLCDYSVKYYANYVQHKRKHVLNDDAHAAKQADLLDEANEIEEADEVTNEMDIDDEAPNKSKSSQSPEEKKLFWCPSCPYTNPRKDAVDNHQKRHVSVSGIKSTYTCNHCDYSVPQSHYLRDHVKLHFLPNKMNHVEGYMVCDNMKLVDDKIDDRDDKIDDRDDKIDERDGKIDDRDDKEQENLIFEEQGSKPPNQFLPILSGELAERFNNNEGEKQFVNMKTGELVVKKENSDTQSSEYKEDCSMEVISQTSSDN